MMWAKRPVTHNTISSAMICLSISISQQSPVRKRLSGPKMFFLFLFLKIYFDFYKMERLWLLLPLYNGGFYFCFVVYPKYRIRVFHKFPSPPFFRSSKLAQEDRFSKHKTARRFLSEKAACWQHFPPLDKHKPKPNPPRILHLLLRLSCRL